MLNEFDTPPCAPIVSPEDARIARRANILAWAVVVALVLVMISVASYAGVMAGLSGGDVMRGVE